MRCLNFIFCLTLLLPVAGFAQTDPHYTMFMYNKLLYNPAYAGSREAVCVNGAYRDQWTGIEGAPKTYSATIDGPVGAFKGSFRSVALGLSFSNEQIGIEKTNNIMAYYAYRIKVKRSVLSFGLEAGAQLYSTNYNQLNLSQQLDPNFANDYKNAVLPNAGLGIYWSSDKFFIGASVPNLLENYYDKNGFKFDNQNSRQINSYYATAGYSLKVSEGFKIQPQVLARYAGNAVYHLPFNADMNLSVIIYDRMLLGCTYRTDKSFEGILHLQVTRQINIGYAYDYMTSALNAYNNGSHELVIGFDFIKEHSKYTTPRFIKTF